MKRVWANVRNISNGDNDDDDDLDRNRLYVYRSICIAVNAAI